MLQQDLATWVVVEEAAGDGADFGVPLSSTASRHLWLGNLPTNVDRQDVEDVFGRFGPLDSVRVFGDKNYGFVNYVNAQHAALAKAALDGRVVPLITGVRPLEIRFQQPRPPSQQQHWQPTTMSNLPLGPLTLGPSLAVPSMTVASPGLHVFGQDALSMGEAATLQMSSGTSLRMFDTSDLTAAVAAEAAAAAAASSGPSRHLWLGNLPYHTDRHEIEALFGHFGPIESVRVFPDKNFGFVNFHSMQHAAAAKAALEGRPVHSLTGSRPLEIRFQQPRTVVTATGMSGSRPQSHTHYHMQIDGATLAECMARSGSASGMATLGTAMGALSLGTAGPDAPLYATTSLSSMPTPAAPTVDGTSADGTDSSSCCADADGSGAGGAEAGPDGARLGPDGIDWALVGGVGRVSTQASRHLWLGNLPLNADRAALEALFGRFGPLESIRVFGDKNYGFVNFYSAQDAAAAKAALDKQPAPTVTGSRPLEIRFQQPRPQRLSPQQAQLGLGLAGLALGLDDPTGLSAAAAVAAAGNFPDLPQMGAMGPSQQLQNALFTARSFGGLGPGEGDATVSSTRVSMRPFSQPFAMLPVDTVAVPAAEHNAVSGPAGAGSGSIPAAGAPVSGPGGVGLRLGGSDADDLAALLGRINALGQLSDDPVGGASGGDADLGQLLLAAAGRDVNGGGVGLGADALAASLQAGAGGPMDPKAQPAASRHLWLGNVPYTADRDALEKIFSAYGPLESVRLFSEKNYAFVNFINIKDAAAAKAALDGQMVPSVTNGKPLLVRFQRDTGSRPSSSADPNGWLLSVEPGDAEAGGLAGILGAPLYRLLGMDDPTASAAGGVGSSAPSGTHPNVSSLLDPAPLDPVAVRLLAQAQAQAQAAGDDGSAASGVNSGSAGGGVHRSVSKEEGALAEALALLSCQNTSAAAVAAAAANAGAGPSGPTGLGPAGPGSGPDSSSDRPSDGAHPWLLVAGAGAGEGSEQPPRPQSQQHQQMSLQAQIQQAQQQAQQQMQQQHLAHLRQQQAANAALGLLGPNALQPVASPGISSLLQASNNAGGAPVDPATTALGLAIAQKQQLDRQNQVRMQQQAQAMREQQAQALQQQRLQQQRLQQRLRQQQEHMLQQQMLQQRLVVAQQQHQQQAAILHQQQAQLQAQLRAVTQMQQANNVNALLNASGVGPAQLQQQQQLLLASGLTPVDLGMGGPLGGAAGAAAGSLDMSRLNDSEMASLLMALGQQQQQQQQQQRQ